jgi:hypothetical protein
MEPDDWYILVFIDALVSVPLFYIVINYSLSQSEKRLYNNIQQFRIGSKSVIEYPEPV